MYAPPNSSVPPLAVDGYDPESGPSSDARSVHIVSDASPVSPPAKRSAPQPAIGKMTAVDPSEPGQMVLSFRARTRAKFQQAPGITLRQQLEQRNPGVLDLLDNQDKLTPEAQKELQEFAKKEASQPLSSSGSRFNNSTSSSSQPASSYSQPALPQHTVKPPVNLKNRGGRPVKGKRVGRHGQWTPEETRNQRLMGQVQLRKDVPVATKVRCNTFWARAGCKYPYDLLREPLSRRERMRRLFGQTLRTMRKWFSNRTELQQLMLRLRVGHHGLRPFGSNLASCKRKSQSLGMRVHHNSTAATRRVPLQHIYSRLEKWIKGQFAARLECRTSQILLRFELLLTQEIAKQEILRDQGSPKYQDVVLTAATHRQDYLSDKPEQKFNWASRALMAKVGGRLRTGQHLSTSSLPPSAALCQLQWDTTDRSTWLAASGSPDDLAEIIMEPERWIANRSSTAIVHTDATALWLKLRGEDKVVIPDDAVQTLKASGVAKRWFKQASTPEQLQLAEALLQKAQEDQYALCQQTSQQASQGGTKHRLTLIASLAVDKWFEPGATPVGSLLMPVLIVNAAQHCRLEDIDNEQRWSRDHEFIGPEGDRGERAVGNYTQGLLSAWVELRRPHPQMWWFNNARVWGQPAAWTDNVISTWHSELIQTQRPQCIHVVDCLASQWMPEVRFAAWKNHQIQVPIMPGATAYLQIPDTHFFAHLKTSIKRAKTQVQDAGEIAARQAGKAYNSQWGPQELLTVLQKSWQDQEYRNRQSQFILVGTVKNQLFIYRQRRWFNNQHAE